MPFVLVRVASKNLLTEVKAFNDGFIAQQRYIIDGPNESLIINIPNELVAPVVEVPIIKQVVAPVVAIAYEPNSMKARICEVFGNQCQNALIIAEHESHFNTNAISKTNDYGVFQLNCKWQGKRVGYDCKKFLDFETNLKLAKQIYDEQGWYPWSTKIYLK